MKFRLLPILFLLLFSFSEASSQSMFGIKTGFNYAGMNTAAPLKGQSSVIGYSLAGSLDSYIYRFLYFQGEIAINQRGYNFISDSNFATRRTFTYLEFPLMIKAVYWKPSVSDNVFGIGFGTSIGYAMFGKESTDDNTARHEFVFTKQYNRLDFGGLINLNYNRFMDFGYLTFDLRFYKGLLETDNSLYTPKNQSVSLSVGLLFYQPKRGLGRRF